MRELKVRVFRKGKGIDKDTIISVICPELSEDNTYFYAQTNKINAVDEMGHICLGGQKVLCDINDSDEQNWLFEKEFEIIEIDGNKKIECYEDEDCCIKDKELIFTFEYLGHNSTWEVLQTIGGITFNGYKTYEQAKSDMEKRYNVVISEDYEVTNKEVVGGIKWDFMIRIVIL